MAYREPTSVREPTDPQLAAVAELGRRVTRTRARPRADRALRDWQFRVRGAHSPWVTAMVALVPTFGGSLVLAPKIAQDALLGVRA